MLLAMIGSLTVRGYKIKPCLIWAVETQQTAFAERCRFFYRVDIQYSNAGLRRSVTFCAKFTA